MKSIKLGQSGLEVTALGLGCMGMSAFYGRADDAEVQATLDRALELGCNFWDTADVYGPHRNEILLGEFLKGRRQRICLATKFGIVQDESGKIGLNGRPEYVKQACEDSLRRLQTDYIDLYYQHRVDPAVPVEETVGAMGDLVSAGKVRYIGLSEANPVQLRSAHAVHPLSALQSEYSLWTRDVEDGVLATCRELGIGLVAYSPLGRGFLAGSVVSLSDLEDDDWRRANPRFTEEAMQANAALVAVIDGVADSMGITKSQLALAWVLAQGEDIAVIPGTKRRRYLEQNCAVDDVELTLDQCESLRAMAEEIPVVGARYGR